MSEMKEVVDEITKYIKDKTKANILDEKEVVNFFGGKYRVNLAILRKCLEDLRKENLFFMTPKRRLVRETWPIDEGGPSEDYEIWRQFYLNP